MIVIIMKRYSCGLKITTSFGIETDGYIRLQNLSRLSVVIYGKTFFLVKTIPDWISYIFIDNAYIDTWVNIIKQLSCFFYDSSTFCYYCQQYLYWYIIWPLQLI